MVVVDCVEVDEVTELISDEILDRAEVRGIKVLTDKLLSRLTAFHFVISPKSSNRLYC